MQRPGSAWGDNYFQSLYANNANLFRGSTAANALPGVTMGLLHELGHAAGYDAGIEAAFNAWIHAHPQTAPSWYAATTGIPPAATATLTAPTTCPP